MRMIQNGRRFLKRYCSSSGGDYVVVEPGNTACHHTMETVEHYDKPGPDTKNPIEVRKCTHCTREVHRATFGETIHPV